MERTAQLGRNKCPKSQRHAATVASTDGAHPTFQTHALAVVKPKAAVLCIQTASPPCNRCMRQSPARSDRRTSFPAAGGAAPKVPTVGTQPPALEGVSTPTIPGYHKPGSAGKVISASIYIEFSQESGNL